MVELTTANLKVSHPDPMVDCIRHPHVYLALTGIQLTLSHCIVCLLKQINSTSYALYVLGKNEKQDIDICKKLHLALNTSMLKY